MELNVDNGGADLAATVPVLRLSGRFDANDTEHFRSAFDQVASDGNPTVAIDMAEVDFIDSAALAELVRAMRTCREDGGDLELVALSAPVLVILELTGLDRAFTINQ